jgi:hypothetical protein
LNDDGDGEVDVGPTEVPVEVEDVDGGELVAPQVSGAFEAYSAWVRDPGASLPFW